MSICGSICSTHDQRAGRATGRRTAIAGLIAQLDFAVTLDMVVANLAALHAAALTPLVADSGEVVGVTSFGVMRVLHRPMPVGRISMLVVDQAWRGHGVGRALVGAVEARLLSSGCGLM